MRNMFGSFGYLALAGGLAIALSSPVAAQTNAGSQPAASDNDNWNKYSLGVFGGVQFWKLTQNGNPPNGQLAPGIAVGVRADQDFTRYIGLEESWTFWAENNLRLTPGQPYTYDVVGLGARNGQVYVGPLFYLAPPSSRVRPFLTVGPAFEYFRPTFEAQRQVHDVAAYNTLTLNTKLAPAVSFGGGVKFGVTEHVNFRLDVRGTYTENPHWGLSTFPATPGALYDPPGGSQLGLLASLGIDLVWGKHPVIAPPATKECHGRQIPIDQPCPNLQAKASVSADRTTVCAGEPVHLTATVDPADASYRWTADGQSGSDKTFTFDTTNSPAGPHTVTLTVSAPGYDSGTGSVSVNVQAVGIPSGTLTANPPEIWLGDKSSLSFNGNAGQCAGSVQVTGYSASEGSVSGSTYDSTGVQLASAACSEQRKEVSVTANLKNDRGATGTAATTIVVKRKQVPLPAVHVADIIFARNSARVNNCGKRILLEELKTYRDGDPTGKVLLVGHIDKGELKKLHLDEKRALNAAAVLTAATGICSNFNVSQVLVQSVGEDQSGELKPHFCESSVTERASDRVSERDKRAEYRRVEVWWIPTCTEVPASAAGAKDAGSAGVAAIGCPK